MFSAKWVMWGSVFVNVVFTLLTPVAANLSYIAVLVVRFIEGLGAVSILFRFLLLKIAVQQETIDFQADFNTQKRVPGAIDKCNGT